MLKKWAAILLSLVATVSFTACGGNAPQANNSPSTPQESTLPVTSAQPSGAPEQTKIKVSVSFDAIKEFVAAVGKDKVEITTIIPAGAEAHDFETKAQDLVKLSEAQIFVYNGLGMEEWAEEAVSAANHADLIVVEASAGADVIVKEDASEEEPAEHADDEAQEEEAEHEERHHHGKYDPHLWLGLKGAQTEVKNIKDALVQADPANQDYYEQNCNDFIAQLEGLYNEFNAKFQSVAKKSFVTGHAAFGYLCRDFGLEQNSVRDIFAEGEPSAKQLAALVEYCKENDVTAIFTEEMVSAEVSQTLANEVGAKVEVIYTMENAQDDMTYLERMESNLSKIYDSLAG